MLLIFFLQINMLNHVEIKYRNILLSDGTKYFVVYASMLRNFFCNVVES